MPERIAHVTAVRVVRERVLHLTFDDGVAGEVDLAPEVLHEDIVAGRRRPAHY